MVATVKPLATPSEEQKEGDTGASEVSFGGRFERVQSRTPHLDVSVPPPILESKDQPRHLHLAEYAPLNTASLLDIHDMSSSQGRCTVHRCRKGKAEMLAGQWTALEDTNGIQLPGWSRNSQEDTSHIDPS